MPEAFTCCAVAPVNISTSWVFGRNVAESAPADLTGDDVTRAFDWEEVEAD